MWAERGVALITQYNKSIMNHEEKKPDLLLLVQHHRRLLPNITKNKHSAFHY